MSSLDAYATVVLAAHFRFKDIGILSFKCRLTRCDAESPMYLEFATIAERGRIDPDSTMMELLHSFPALLSTKRIQESTVKFLDGEGCLMQFKYPGRMVADASPFLRDRSVDLWPEITLCLKPTDELRRRARNIVDFLRGSDSVEGTPN